MHLGASASGQWRVVAPERQQLRLDNPSSHSITEAPFTPTQRSSPQQRQTEHSVSFTRHVRHIRRSFGRTPQHDAKREHPQVSNDTNDSVVLQLRCSNEDRITDLFILTTTFCSAAKLASTNVTVV